MDAAKRIGLNISDSGIMMSRKSAIAITVASYKEQETLKNDHAWCKLLGLCRYRKSGVRYYA